MPITESELKSRIKHLRLAKDSLLVYPELFWIDHGHIITNLGSRAARFTHRFYEQILMLRLVRHLAGIALGSGY